MEKKKLVVTISLALLVLIGIFVGGYFVNNKKEKTYDSIELNVKINDLAFKYSIFNAIYSTIDEDNASSLLKNKNLVDEKYFKQTFIASYDKYQSEIYRVSDFGFVETKDYYVVSSDFQNFNAYKYTSVNEVSKKIFNKDLEHSEILNGDDYADQIKNYKSEDYLLDPFTNMNGLDLRKIGTWKVKSLTKNTKDKIYTLTFDINLEFDNVEEIEPQNTVQLQYKSREDGSKYIISVVVL